MEKQNNQLIEEFYSGFAAGNSTTMLSCYHPEATFEDPAFGILQGKDASDMWEMLILRSQGSLNITFSNVKSNGSKGSADWTARYVFSSTKRQVVNNIHAEFEFRDGLIYKHRDSFDLYNWSKQALGLKGLLFGWTPFFKRKIQQNAMESLRSFQRKKEKGL